MPVTFTVLGIDHVVFRVRDLDRMIRFYADVLGCQVDHRQEHLRLVHVRAGRTLIDLVQVRQGESLPDPGMGNQAHLCLRIDPWEPAALRRHLGRLGVTAEWAESNYGAEGTGPSLYLQDPEGNLLELKGPAQASHGKKVD